MADRLSKVRQTATPVLVLQLAPNYENHTAACIYYVSTKMNIAPDDKIDTDNMLIMMRLFSAMCRMENGRDINLDDTISGWFLAKNMKRKT